MATPAELAARSTFAAFRRQSPRILRLPDLRGTIATGSRIVANIPVGSTYHNLQVQFLKASSVPATEAEIIAQVGRVTLTVDGDPKISLTGAEAVMFAKFYGNRSPAAAIVKGVLPLWLSRPWWPEFASQDGPAYGTLDVGAVTLEVEFIGTVTIVSANLVATVTDGEPLGRHITIRRIADNQAAAGLKTISDFKPDLTKQLIALHIDKAGGIQSGPILSFQLKADQRNEWEGHYDHIESMLSMYELVQQTGWSHFPFAFRGRPIDSLPMVMQDLRLELTTGTALGNFNTLCEYAEGVSAA
jgi:hypothetical protein